MNSKSTFFQILPVLGVEPSNIVTVQGCLRVIVGMHSFSTVVGDMKLDKAPTESYADIGGLEQQIQEIKVRPSYVAMICSAC